MYDVDEYLHYLTLAKLSPNTIRTYRKILLHYSRFLGVPLESLHTRLDPKDLIRYVKYLEGQTQKTIRTKSNIVHRYMEVNDITFDRMQMSVVRGKVRQDPSDKPLLLDLLQKMMDQGDEHQKAIITFCTSTAIRPGEAAQLLLSDVNGDTVTIRPEIAKGGRGGTAYLTSEAREYLDTWLNVRDLYIRRSDAKSKGIVEHGGAHKRPENDQRLFACAYTSIHRAFNDLYKKVDGERGARRYKCTPHSMRKFFRTNAVETMGLDVTEKIMRHEGYLSSSYVRLSDEEVRRKFHAGEAALYITRGDQRYTKDKIQTMEQQIKDQDLRIAALHNLIEHGKS